MSLVDWYADRTLFLTGGTGFMGKVMIEKLLRCCPDVRRIYIMVRPKKGLSPVARIDELAKLPLFEKVRTTSPDQFAKLVAVEGDITQNDLGLKASQVGQLMNEVSVVFHCAASLRLEAGLKDAIQSNTVATQKVLELCKGMKHLEAFIHLSTAFCHCELESLEEKMYPPPADPHDVMRAMEWLDDETIKEITPRLLGAHPNCYTYSKRLAEHLVAEYAEHLPVAIVRPSVVSPTLKDPFPGWVDTLNGPVGILVGAGKGVIRTMMAGAEYTCEMIPVDIAINCILIVAWKLASASVRETRPEKIPVYNATTADVVRMTWGEALERSKHIVLENPFEGGVWYPNGNMRTNRTAHNLAVLFFHILPAYFLDFLLLLALQKRFMVRLQRRISVGLEVLQYFTMRDWHFRNDNALKLHGGLDQKNRDIFFITNVDLDIQGYMKTCILGARQYCMKEPLSSLPQARRHQTMLYVLDRITVTVFYCGMVYLLAQWSGLSRYLLDPLSHGLQLFPGLGFMVPPSDDVLTSGTE